MSKKNTTGPKDKQLEKRSYEVQPKPKLPAKPQPKGDTKGKK